MPWSYANIDWNGTGAMVQAVGSVAAILAAVVIDQGAARRLRNDRLEEKREAIDDRRSAILGVAGAVDGAAEQLAHAELAPRQFVSLSEDRQRSLRAAESVVEFYMTRGGDAGARLAMALASALEVSRRARSLVASTGSINFNTRDDYVSLLREQSAVARSLVAQFDAGT